MQLSWYSLEGYDETLYGVDVDVHKGKTKPYLFNINKGELSNFHVSTPKLSLELLLQMNFNEILYGYGQASYVYVPWTRLYVAAGRGRLSSLRDDIRGRQATANKRDVFQGQA